jgi:hypothetical protein
VILCDTTCLHRGGYATADPRLVFVAEYVSPASIQRQYVTAIPSLDRQAENLPAMSRFALGL